MRDMPLEGLRVIESSLLEPGQVAMNLAALGADVIKVEAPDGGDYSRELGWPMIDGVSLLHWHINQGKRSIVLDLRKPDGLEVYLDLVKSADVVVEGMRPGALARCGLGYHDLTARNPGVVMLSMSMAGQAGPLAGHHQGHQVTEAAATGQHAAGLGAQAQGRRHPAGELAFQARQAGGQFLGQEVVVEAGADQFRHHRGGEGWRIEVGQGAGMAGVVGPLHHLLQLSQPVATGLMGEAYLGLLPRQGTSYKQDPICETGYALPVMG